MCCKFVCAVVYSVSRKTILLIDSLEEPGREGGREREDTVYMHVLDVPTQPTCMNGGYWELHQQLQSRLGARGQTGTRASAHMTFQRTTSERKLFLCQTSAATVLFG